MSDKTDITMYGERELDMIVQNDEYLYKEFMRACRRGFNRNTFGDFMSDNIDSFYLYTEAQEEELRASYESEVTSNEEDN